METIQTAVKTAKPLHSWLRQVRVAFVPGPLTPLMHETIETLLETFRQLGHHVQDHPDKHTDILLTTALFGTPLPWRRAMLFTARRRFHLPHLPTLFTMVHATPQAFYETLQHLENALAQPEPDPQALTFPGMARQSYRVLFEQGQRGGPIMALERIVQSQAKSIRILLLVGEDKPETVYHFDLAGGYPRTDYTTPQDFYKDIVLRMVTVVSTHEVTAHHVVGDPIPQALWRTLSTPQAMREASRQLDRRHFFTNMIRIADLVDVPAVTEAVASQYSEGCFATWDPTLRALIATVTGSARPVDKGELSDHDLAVIVGVREDREGALIRHVEGLRNDPPSSEAVEMMEMLNVLPTVHPPAHTGIQDEVPVVRSVLHGHRGVSAFDPTYVEFTPLDPPYYHYPVSCATEAQARGIREAFRRAESLRNPEDPRQIAFTILPCHGVVIAEKWIPGKAPFQAIWEAIDAGALVIDSYVPQGPLHYQPNPRGLSTLEEITASKT